MVKYIGRAAILKSTGRLIEYQSGGKPTSLGTLTQNAVNAGIDAADVEEKYVTQKQYLELITAVNEEAAQIQAAERQAKLDAVDKADMDELKEIIKGLL